MPSTTNFGWTTPADTNYVKNGAADMRTLANGIDTSLVDLKGGTTDQVLAKNSNTDLDYKWTSLAPVLISTTTLTGTTTTISSIPSGYSILRVQIDNVNPISTSDTIRFFVAPNNSSDSSFTFWRGGTETRTNLSIIELGNIRGSTNVGENTFILDIHNYDSTTYRKPFEYFGGDGNSSGQIVNGVGVYANTTAITSLVFSTIASTGTNGFDSGTVRLFGVR